MRLRSLAVLCAASLVATSTASAQATNSSKASLVVNQNVTGTFPLQVLMGQLDPNLVEIAGQAGASFLLFYGAHDNGQDVPGLGTLHIRLDLPFGIVPGVLDASGKASLPIPPNALNVVPAGAKFTLQAAVADRSSPSGFRLSGASDATVLEWLTSPFTITPAVGTTAKILGPLTAISSTTVSVGNIPFRVLSTTTYSNVESLSELSLGDWVQLNALTNATGGFDAEEIGLEDAASAVRLTGMVQGVGVGGIALMNVSVYITPQTTYSDQGLPSSYAAVVDGMIVEVRIPVNTADFPFVTQMSLNLPSEFEPEPEDVPEEEIENETPPPSFCS